MQSVSVRTSVLCLALLASVSGDYNCKQLFVCPTSRPTCVCPEEPCLTLDQYVENSDTYITSNTVFKLLPGQHDLTSPFVVQDVENITIEGQQEGNDSSFPVISYQNFSSGNRFSAAVHLHNTSRVSVVGVKINAMGKTDKDYGVGVHVRYGKNIFISSFGVCVRRQRSQSPTNISPHNKVSIGMVIDESTNVTIINITIPESDFGVYVGNSSNVQLSNMNMSNSYSAIYMNETKNVICTKIFISNVTGYGMYLSKTMHTTVSNTLMFNIGRCGVYATYSMNTEILHTSVNNAHDCIALSYANNTTLLHTSLRNATFAGLYMSGAERTTVSHNDVNETKIGILLSRTIDTTISNTSVSNIGRTAISLYDTTSTTVLCVTVDNTISNGMFVNLAQHTTISHCHVKHTESVGIWIMNSKQSSLSDITFTDSTSLGGVLVQNSEHTTVSNTSVNNAGGISFYNTKYTTVVYATVIDAGYGITFLNTEQTVLSHSYVKNSQFSGIKVTNAIHTTISDVVVSNITLRHPAIAIWGTNYTTLLHASVNNVIEDGVFASDTEHTTIFQCRINTTGRNGIELRRAEYTLISHTIVNDAGLHGIAICDSYFTNIFNTNVNAIVQC